MQWKCDEMWKCEEMVEYRKGFLSKDDKKMAMEISIRTLKGSTNNELWKLGTYAWTNVTELIRRNKL